MLPLSAQVTVLTADTEQSLMTVDVRRPGLPGLTARKDFIARLGRAFAGR